MRVCGPRCLDLPPPWLPRRKLLLQGFVCTSVSRTNWGQMERFVESLTCQCPPLFSFPVRLLVAPLLLLSSQEPLKVKVMGCPWG